MSNFRKANSTEEILNVRGQQKAPRSDKFEPSVPVSLITSNSNVKGPDRILHSEKLTTSEANGCVKIRESFEEAEPMISVPTFFKESVENFSRKAALAFKKSDGLWNFITYSEYYHNVRTAAKAFLKLGLGRFRAVAVIGSSTPECPIALLAAIFAGGFAAGIHPIYSHEISLHCLRKTMAEIVIVEDDALVQKVLEIRSQIPQLKAIIQYSGIPTHSSVLSWNQMLEIGESEKDRKLEEVLESLAVNQCCTILFTSGTTSLPKAVMLSHDNIVFWAKTTAKCLGLGNTTERSFCYSGVSHNTPVIFNVFACLFCGGCCYFPDKNGLSSEEVFFHNLKEIRPTYLFGTPRVWQKIKELIQLTEKSIGVQERALENSNQAVNQSMKALIGLDCCHTFVTGAAPLFIEVREYLRRFCILFRERYGMTEIGSCHISSVDFDGPGKALPGIRTKVDKPDEEGIGEICVYGRNVFMGYLQDPEKTEETVDKDGWLHSGDLGKFDHESNLTIRGRIKELLVTSDGDNIPPVPIEKAIKSELPILGEVIVVGDRKPFLSLLITLKCKTDENGTPLDELSEETKDWCRSLNCNYETLSDIIKEKPKELYDAIEKGIARANAKAISTLHRIEKFCILPGDFSVNTGEIGPTMKVMRHVVHEKYKNEIEAMYNS